MNLCHEPSFFQIRGRSAKYRGYIFRARVLNAPSEAVKNCNRRIFALYVSVSYPVGKGVFFDYLTASLGRGSKSLGATARDEVQVFCSVGNPAPPLTLFAQRRSALRCGTDAHFHWRVEVDPEAGHLGPVLERQDAAAPGGEQRGGSLVGPNAIGLVLL